MQRSEPLDADDADAARRQLLDRVGPHGPEPNDGDVEIVGAHACRPETNWRKRSDLSSPNT